MFITYPTPSMKVGKSVCRLQVVWLCNCVNYFVGEIFLTVFQTQHHSLFSLNPQSSSSSFEIYKDVLYSFLKLSLSVAISFLPVFLNQKLVVQTAK